MKTFKAKLILTVITLTILLLATGTRTEAKSRKELGKITRVHGNEITCVDDRTGNAWEFYGTGYHAGERCRITFKGKRVVDCVTDRQLVKRYCKKHFRGYKIKFVDGNKFNFQKRKSKRFVYVERIVSRSKGRYGLTADGGYIRYNMKVKRGKRVVSYAIWNPRNNIEDDVVAVVDNGIIR